MPCESFWADTWGYFIGITVPPNSAGKHQKGLRGQSADNPVSTKRNGPSLMMMTPQPCPLLPPIGAAGIAPDCYLSPILQRNQQNIITPNYYVYENHVNKKAAF